MTPKSADLLTLGHSNHSREHFAELLSLAEIEVLVDVRSWPHSRHVEWADCSRLPDVARGAGSKYLFLGDRLGGRPDDRSLYDAEGHVLYGRVAATETFRIGIARLKKGISGFRLAIMCSEENPEFCHRRLLVSKVLLDEGFGVTHIRGDGRTESEPGPIDLSQGSLFEDEDLLWRSTRSVLRGPRQSTSLAA